MSEVGSVIVDSTVADSEPIEMGGHGGLRLYFPTGFTADCDIFELDHLGNYVDSNLNVTVPAVLPGSVAVDADIFAAKSIKLKCAGADDGKTVGYRLKT